MAMWRCPHCGTPQAEAARCWVCRRSSTSCGTCRHYRRSVAVGVGYCGLDARRSPLQGDEIEPCWEGSATVTFDFAARLARPAEAGADTAPDALPLATMPSGPGSLWAESEA